MEADTSLTGHNPLPKPQESGRWAVYKLYDVSDTLLYVGMSRHVGRRLQQHARNQEWWPQVADKEILYFNSYEDAERWEHHQIVWLRPVHNRHYNYGKQLDSEWTPVPRYGKDGRELKAAGWEPRRDYSGRYWRTRWRSPAKGEWYEEGEAMALLRDGMNSNSQGGAEHF